MYFLYKVCLQSLLKTFIFFKKNLPKFQKFRFGLLTSYAERLTVTVMVDVGESEKSRQLMRILIAFLVFPAKVLTNKQTPSEISII